jgi:inorganic phosphate transporter, PiT family
MGASAVKWGIARTIALAWILTIPLAALIGFVVFAVIRVFIGY